VGPGGERENENGEKTCWPAAEVARYEVRKNPQEPAQTRGSRQEKANRLRLAFKVLVGWGQLKDGLKPLWILDSLSMQFVLFPGLFPGFLHGSHTVCREQT
jgi:hypothetical protein